MSQWNPSKEDVKALAEAVLLRCEAFDENFRDYCHFCRSLKSSTGTIKHENDCPVLIAQDLLTGIDRPGSNHATTA